MTEDARLARTAPSLHLTAAVPPRIFGKILAAENSAGGPRVRVPGSCKAQSRCFHCTCGTRQVPELGSSQTSSVPSDRENLVPKLSRRFSCESCQGFILGGIKKRNHMPHSPAPHLNDNLLYADDLRHSQGGVSSVRTNLETFPADYCSL